MASADILRAAHSPLPWRIYPGHLDSIYSQDGEVLIVERGSDFNCLEGESTPDNDEARANAAFIVRACNAHYQMLEALKTAQAALDFADFPETLKAVRAAIAAAEAEALS